MYELTARAVRISSDKLTYHFLRRPEARFHDGTPLTAHDVALSLNLLKQKGHPIIQQMLRDMDGAAAADETTAVVRFAARARRAAICRRSADFFARLLRQARHMVSAQDHDNTHLTEPPSPSPIGPRIQERARLPAALCWRVYPLCNQFPSDHEVACDSRDVGRRLEDKMFQGGSLAALFGLALALPAGAADMRVKAPVAPPPPPPFTWTGCYLGGFVGGAFADRDPVFTDLGNGRFGSFSGGITAPGIAGIHSWAVPVDDSIIGGGTLGCNWQFAGSPFVLGIEGEGGYMRFSGAAFDPSRGPNTLVAPFTPDVLGAARIGDWYAMATGRVGYAFNTVLFYVKGGAAFVPVKASVVDNCTTGGCGNWLIATAVDDTATVGTIGGGIEWAFAPNWSMKAEYMFIGLGGHGLTSCGTATLASGAVVSGGDFCFAHDFPDIHTVKLGINWRFGSIFGP